MRKIAQIRKVWYNATSSLWFVPALMAAGAVALAFGLTALDTQLQLGDQEAEGWGVLQSSASAARDILTTIASTSATVLGVVFSITIIALQLASTQYSPRVLREFMRDTGSQVVMGTFIATFIYSLLAARSVRDLDEGIYFVPVLTLAGGILLALASVVALIYFINHIAESIQVSNLVAQLGRATLPLVDVAFPKEVGRPVTAPASLTGHNSVVIESQESGYIQVIEAEALLALAEKHDLLFEFLHRVGDFVADGEPLLRVAPRQGISRELIDEIHGLIALGRRRTLQQDAEFGVRQIADIAVKAMSPSINDPTTAMLCLDWFGALLRRIGERADPVPVRADAANRPRLVIHGTSFSSMLWLMFTPLRVYAAKDPNVVIRMLEVLRQPATLIRSEERRNWVWTHAVHIAEAADHSLRGELERSLFNERLSDLARLLQRDPVPSMLSSVREAQV